MTLHCIVRPYAADIPAIVKAKEDKSRERRVKYQATSLLKHLFRMFQSGPSSNYYEKARIRFISSFLPPFQAKIWSKRTPSANARLCKPLPPSIPSHPPKRDPTVAKVHMIKRKKRASRSSSSSSSTPPFLHLLLSDSPSSPKRSWISTSTSQPSQTYTPYRAPTIK